VRALGGCGALGGGSESGDEKVDSDENVRSSGCMPEFMCVKAGGGGVAVFMVRGAVAVCGDAGGVGVPVPRSCGSRGEARRRGLGLGVGDASGDRRIEVVEQHSEAGSVGTSGESLFRCGESVHTKEPFGVTTGVGMPSVSCELPCE
jgi:hypothetical protein